ncbi:uncharacterized protein LOC111334847 isoform X1 [Stylophora pistillata]|uniref:uncharacterized protein LOC111334847 isoform X1 n=1 Tax=Stylophora pistillata TaxID=50429 RepID=UPI000C04C2F4|nr:uncharacterized protein LOC111334847 isoform X1 [Stylophora pistillata]
MSVVEYRNVLYQFSKEIDWQNERERMIFICKGFLPDGSVDDITDVISLLSKLEENNLLEIDRLYVLKELLKGLRKWDLLRLLERFEVKRKDYKQLLERISRALDESNELPRLISICRRQNLIAHEREERILNLNSLFTELEQQNNLGIENLTILKSLATEVEKPDLCKLVEEFGKKRKQEDGAERERKEWDDCKRRAQAKAASVLTSGINIGERVIGVVTPHCTFRNLTGGAVVVTTWMVLRRSPSMEAFVDAFKEAVLPFGNFLRAISEGSTRFIIQSESISALDALWQSYQDETLPTDLQEFLVTEEIKQLAGGEVTLTVRIDEDEYRNAMFDLMISETEDLETELQEKRGLIERANSDSDLLKERKMTTDDTRDPSPEKGFLPFRRKVLVEEYLENIQETYSEIARQRDSGVGTWSNAPSEYGFDKGEGDRLEQLDLFEVSFKDVMDKWNSLHEVFREAYPYEAFNVKKKMDSIRFTLKALKEGERMWMHAEHILSSSNRPEAIITQLKISLQLGEYCFTKPTSKEKTLIRGFARKAKILKRMDVFDHLRQITPGGTTGPLLPDDLLIDEMPEIKKEILSSFIQRYLPRDRPFLKWLNLSLKDIFMVRIEKNLLHIIIKRNGLRTVGELYDFLSEHRLAYIAVML